MKEYLNPTFEFNKCFVIYHFPCYYTLSYDIIFILSKLFSLYVAGKILLTIYVISMPLSAIYFLKSCKRNASLSIFSFLLIYSSFLHKGNIGFVCSIPLTLLALGYIIRNEKGYFISSLLLLLVYLMHPYSFFVTALFVFLRKRKLSISLLPSIILLIISPVTSEFFVKWLNPLMKLRELSIYFLSFSYIKEGIVILPIYILGLYLFIKGPKEYKPVFFMYLFAFFILPDYFMGGDHVAQRILPFVLLFGMVSLKDIKWKFVIIPFLILHLWTITKTWRDVNNVYNKYYKALEVIPVDAKIEIVSNKEDLYIGQIGIFSHFQYYYHIKKGGISEEGFFTGPPVIYTCNYKENNEQWIIRFKKLRDGYDIQANKK